MKEIALTLTMFVVGIVTLGAVPGRAAPDSRDAYTPPAIVYEGRLRPSTPLLVRNDHA